MPIIYDRAKLAAAVRDSVFSGHLRAGQIAGMDAIVGRWEALQPAGDTRWLAYLLGTAMWETAATMQPIEEIGHGRGRAYGHPAGPWHQLYDGRGYVQLTWQANYRKATQRLRAHRVIGADVDLERNPPLALRPEIAAAIMIYGMIEGWFTGRKLADYFHGTASDWVNARRIINGTDHATDVARYAERFFTALKRAQGHPAAASSQAVPAPPATATKSAPPTAPTVDHAAAMPRPAAPSPPPRTGLWARFAALFNRR